MQIFSQDNCQNQINVLLKKSKLIPKKYIDLQNSGIQRFDNLTVAYNRKIIEESKDKCRVSLSFINYINNIHLCSEYQNKQWNSKIPICRTPKL